MAGLSRGWMMEADRSAANTPILIMDDTEMILECARIFLGKAGFEVSCATSGAEAVELYRAGLASGRRFAAVILDVNVPGGPGGPETLQALRALDPQVNAFVSSGNPEDPAITNHRALGFAGVIEKPDFYLRPALAERLRALL